MNEMSNSGERNRSEIPEIPSVDQKVAGGTAGNVRTCCLPLAVVGREAWHMKVGHMRVWHMKLGRPHRDSVQDDPSQTL